MPPAPTPPPARRADAARNRDKILEAARAAFAEADGDVSMAEISRRAGVGMATLYRNFAGRRELLEALYVDEVDAVVRAAEAVEGEAPGKALVTWLRRFVAYFTSKGPVAAELLDQPDGRSPVFGEGRPRVLAAGRSLLAAAQDAGEVRADLTLEQVLDMTIAIARINGDPAYVDPILRAAFDGLRPPA